MRIPVTKPLFGPEERRAVQEPLETGWVTQGRRVQECEEKVQRFVEARHAAAVTSCTAAPHLGLTALGLRPGDEVNMPAFTWVATDNAVERAGGRPVFCDVSLRDFNINPEEAEKKVTPKSAGIIPVHLFGLCADMEAILRIAEKHRLWVVKDAACTLGAARVGRSTGTFGAVGALVAMQATVTARVPSTQRHNLLASVDRDTREALRALAAEPEERVMAFPFTRCEAIVYFCQKKVIADAHSTEWEPLGRFWPVLRQPVERLLKRYQIDWVWVDTRCVDLQDLRLPAALELRLRKGPVYLFRRLPSRRTRPAAAGAPCVMEEA